jgi:hypothetical protein
MLATGRKVRILPFLGELAEPMFYMGYLHEHRVLANSSMNFAGYDGGNFEEAAPK